jgi:hypothetical protein
LAGKQAALPSLSLLLGEMFFFEVTVATVGAYMLGRQARLFPPEFLHHFGRWEFSSFLFKT